MYSNLIAKHNTALSGAMPFLYAKTVALHGAKPLPMAGTGVNAKQILMMIPHRAGMLFGVGWRKRQE